MVCIDHDQQCKQMQTLVYAVLDIGVAGGAVGAPAPRRAETKIRSNSQGKFVSAPQHTKCTPRQSN